MGSSVAEDENGDLVVVPWTETQLEMIAGYVTAGASIPAACEAAGVPYSTAKNWLTKGNKNIAPYSLFVAAMRKAKAMHEVGARLIISNAAHKDWRAAAWLEDRRAMQTQRARAMAAQQPAGADGVDDRTVLYYPVPVPEGTEPGQLEAFARTGQTIDVPHIPEDEP